MRRTILILISIILLQFVGCASRRELSVKAQGQAQTHTVCKPDFSGFENVGAASACLDIEYRAVW